MRHRLVAIFVLVMALTVTGCAPADGVAVRPVAAHASATATPPGPSPARPTPPARPGPTKKPDRSGGGGAGPLGTTRTTGNKSVALTFDDGPSPEWTPKVLDYLKANGVKATFCLVGVKAQQNPQLVARIVREGHTLCNHSWRHDLALGRKSDTAIRADLLRTNEAIRRAVPGARIAYFRQPGGMWTPQVVTTARALGMVPLHWDVDPQDWARPGGPAIVQRVESHIHPGSIVLMHDGGGDRSGTLAACHLLMPWLKQRFKLVRLP
jgi:peptidoglycan/xylan/chitin deacetylase (PgdA/CDA1 family)